MKVYTQVRLCRGDVLDILDLPMQCGVLKRHLVQQDVPPVLDKLGVLILLTPLRVIVRRAPRLRPPADRDRVKPELGDVHFVRTGCFQRTNLVDEPSPSRCDLLRHWLCIIFQRAQVCLDRACFRRYPDLPPCRPQTSGLVQSLAQRCALVW